MTDPQQPGSSGFDPKTNSAPDLWAQAATNSIADLDRWMAADLSAEKIASKPFAHLPVLGVPGWWPANTVAGFYDDASVFRLPRQSPNSIGSIAADVP